MADDLPLASDTRSRPAWMADHARFDPTLVRVSPRFAAIGGTMRKSIALEA